MTDPVFKSYYPGNCNFAIYDHSARLAEPFPAEITATAADQLVMAPMLPYRVTGATFSVESVGADADDDLAIELDVKIAGTTIFTTKPKITKEASSPAFSGAAGTGITPGEVDEDALEGDPGDRLTVSLNITRTTPESEITGVVVFICMDRTE